MPQCSVIKLNITYGGTFYHEKYPTKMVFGGKNSDVKPFRALIVMVKLSLALSFQGIEVR